MGGSTDKPTEVRQQLALAALRLASAVAASAVSPPPHPLQNESPEKPAVAAVVTACTVGRYLNQQRAPALYDAGEPTVVAMACDRQPSL
jgi:hypothetical protein